MLPKCWTNEAKSVARFMPGCDVYQFVTDIDNKYKFQYKVCSNIFGAKTCL